MTMNLRMAPWVAVAAISIFVGKAAAQTPLLDRLNEGARVRLLLQADTTQRIWGDVVGTRAGSELLRVSTHHDDARIDVPASAVRRLDVSHGRAHWTGAAVGALAGGVAGGIIAAIGFHDPSHSDNLEQFVGTLAGIMMGVPVGALAGYLAAPERWGNVIDNSAAPAGGNAHLTLRDGASVRVSTLAHQKLTRRKVARFSGDTLWLRENGASAPYALRSLQRLDVRGEPDRRAGVLRGAAVLGGIAVVFGGIDTARGASTGGEYAWAMGGNAIIGALIGYFIAPRGWQALPLPR